MSDKANMHDLMKALMLRFEGAVERPDEMSAMFTDFRQFDIGELRISLRAGYGAKGGRATISINAPTLQKRLRDPKWHIASITVDVSRPIDKIAEDIRRRLIMPATARMNELVDELAKQDAGDMTTASRLANIQGRYPSIRVVQGNDKSVANLSYYNDGEYFAARLDANGKILFDRIGSIEHKKALEIIDILTRES